MGFFTQIKEKLVGKSTKQNEKYVVGLDKSSETFSDRINELAARFREINDEYFEELENILIMADVGVSMVMKIVSEIKTEVRIRNITDPREINDIIVDKMFVIYANESVMSTKINYSAEGLTVILMVGVNGAGKTTLLQTISGLLKKSGGDILFMGKSLNKANAKHIVKAGITQVPEGRHIFPEMSVYENLLMGAYLRKDKDGIKKDLEMVYQRFPRLKDRLSQDASTLSGGEQQMLAMGRALMARPKILLLDEPSMGLAPILVKEIFSIIKDINAQGTTILLVEQNAKMALSIADRAYVMETGNIVMCGSGEELAHSEEIQKAYLGG